MTTYTSSENLNGHVSSKLVPRNPQIHSLAEAGQIQSCKGYTVQFPLPCLQSGRSSYNSAGRTNGLDGQSVSSVSKSSDLPFLRDHHTSDGGGRNGLIALTILFYEGFPR